MCLQHLTPSLLVAGLISVAVALTPQNSNAQAIRVEVENFQPADGFFFTPLWVGFHDGSFDFFDAGSMASPSLEALAEEGDFSGISSDFSGFGTDGAVFGFAGFPNAPVFDPGETASAVFNLGAGERYFSFASMIIPSNDGFFANDLGTAYEIFDAAGIFNGPLTIMIVGGDLWDAGTEVNDGQGAAFSQNGGQSTDENGLIAPHPGLDNFLGTLTAAGTTIGSIPGPDTPIARITISQIPEPTSLGFVGALTGITFLVRKRRR